MHLLKKYFSIPIEKIIFILTLFTYLFFIFAFFSPSLPRLGISLRGAREELFFLLLFLSFLFCFLKRKKLLVALKKKKLKIVSLTFLIISLTLLLTRLPYLINDFSLLNADKSVTLLMVKNIAEGKSFPLYFYGQLYQGSLNAYLTALIFFLIPSLKISVLLINIIFFSLFILFSSLLLRRITDSTSYFYPVLILCLPLSGLVFFSNDEIRGFSVVVFFEILLIYLAYRIIFDSRDYHFSVGMVTGVLFWLYQPSLSTILPIYAGIFFSELRRSPLRKSLSKGILALTGFIAGSFPHLLGEINNEFTNTKVLFFSGDFPAHIKSMKLSSLLSALKALLFDLDSQRIISLFFILIFFATIIICLCLFIKKKETKKIFLPALMAANLLLLLLSMYPPVPRYIVHYRFFSFYPLLICSTFFMEFKIFSRKRLKFAFIIFFAFFSGWKSVKNYPMLREAHFKNKKDICELKEGRENLILGNYWDMMKYLPFMEDKLLISTPSEVRIDGVFPYAKYLPLGFKLGEFWEKESRAFLVPRKKEASSEEFLRDLGISFAKKEFSSGRYALYSKFSREISPYLLVLLNSDLKKRWEGGKRPNFIYFKNKLPSLPELKVREGNLILNLPEWEDLPSQSRGAEFFKDWRYCLKTEEEKLSFPLNLKSRITAYSYPQHISLQGNKYKAFINFLDIPILEAGEVEIKGNSPQAKLIISRLRDALTFFPIWGKERKPRIGVPVEGLKLEVVNPSVVSIELRIFSFFNFDSSLWTNFYQQTLHVNGEKIPLKYGENRILNKLHQERVIKLNTEFKTLLYALDSRGNVTFPNSGAILESIILHEKGQSYILNPFLSPLE